MQIGTGHLIRCLTLANVVRPMGTRVRFVCRHVTPFLSARLAEAGHELILLPPAADSALGSGYAAWLGASQEQDARDTAAALRDSDWDWLVVDHYGLDAQWETALRPVCRRVMVVDDLANRRHDCDVLLDQNLASSTSRYKQLVPATCRRFEGPSYALLRPGFGDARQKLAKGRERKGLNIFFGGTDPAGATLKALDAIQAIQDCDFAVDVIAGNDNPRLEEIATRCATLTGAVLHVQPRDMAALFSRAALALGAGGTASWERCCLGLPTVIIRIAENQRDGSAALAKARAAVDMGPLEQVSSAKLAGLLLRLASRPRLLAAMGRRASALVDGRGAERIAIYLARHTIQLRLAREEDAQQAWQWRNDGAIRRRSFDPAPLSWSTHRAWWSEAIKSGNRHMLVAVCCGQDVGILRFDTQKEEAVVSIYLDPGLTGLGLGHTILRAGEAWLRASLPAIRIVKAQILSGNKASAASFEAAGYQRHGDRPVWFRTLSAQ